MSAPRILALLAAALILAACSREAPAPPEAAPDTPTASAAEAPAPAQQQAQAEPDYEIPPFPVSGVPLCDTYASEARRCLNQPGHDNQRRLATEQSILQLLEDITPEDPDDAPNPWLEGSCRKGLETLAMRYPACDVQGEH